MEQEYTDIDSTFSKVHDIQERLITEMSQKVEKAIEEIVIDALQSKGMGHLINLVESAKGHKFIICKQEEWNYLFAYNGTKEGLFIVAYSYGYELPNTDINDFKISTSMNLRSQKEYCPDIISYAKKFKIKKPLK